MKTWVYIFSLLPFVTCCYATCEKPCFGSVCSDAIHFKLLDKTTQQDLLFGLNPKYKMDSMQLNRMPDFALGKHNNFIGMITGDYHYLSAATDIPLDTTYLRLTYNDIDTLSVQYALVSNECCTRSGGYGKIVSIKYNGKTALKEGDYYKFEKE